MRIRRLLRVDGSRGAAFPNAFLLPGATIGLNVCPRLINSTRNSPDLLKSVHFVPGTMLSLLHKSFKNSMR